LHFTAVLQVNNLELKTNLLAAYVSAGLSAQLPELMRQLGIKPRDSFEIAYNRCGLQRLSRACVADIYKCLADCAACSHASATEAYVKCEATLPLRLLQMLFVTLLHCHLEGDLVCCVVLMVAGVEAHAASSSSHTTPPSTYAGFKCEHTTRSSFIHVACCRAVGLAEVGDEEAAETAVKAAYKQGE
jgi:hypothetical protein